MESITTYMQHDHELIDGIAERASAAAAGGDSATLAREAAQFLQRLERHIEMEEHVLFPAFEQRTGMREAGPSVQMRAEHEQMRGILAQMRDAMKANDAPGYRSASRALFEILVPHNMKEEQMMYPMLDDAMGADGAALLADVKAMAIA
ncbi:MAG: hemerythrin domain-containing protein [Ideonella sp.]|nr:hemerythrin domain-containing protein [Ideonella sp.]MCC7456329.1 hemerythrin domain-containing protein [Nitrospira sp.]